MTFMHHQVVNTVLHPQAVMRTKGEYHQDLLEDGFSSGSSAEGTPKKMNPSAQLNRGWVAMRGYLPFMLLVLFMLGEYVATAVSLQVDWCSVIKAHQYLGHAPALMRFVLIAI